MPIVVEEVVISVEVADGRGEEHATSTPHGGGEDKHAIVAECVERVLDVLRQREER